MSEFQWSEKETHELYDALDELNEVIQKTVNAAMNDGRPSIEETPIPSKHQDYEEHYYAVQSELINRGEI